MSKKKHTEEQSEAEANASYTEVVAEETEGIDVTPAVLINGEFPTVEVSTEPVEAGSNQPGVLPPSVVGTSQDPTKEVQ